MEHHAASTIDDREPDIHLPKRSLVCDSCGYGILRPTPPDRCPMCQTEDAWVDARWLTARGAAVA